MPYRCQERTLYGKMAEFLPEGLQPDLSTRLMSGMFVRHGLMLTGIGVACGLVVAFLVMRLMSTLLFKVSPADPVTYAAVSIGLGVTAFVAS